jgi:hypothetical protein
MGKDEEFLMQQARRAGMRNLPDRLANAPEVRDGLQLFYLAFLELTTCRGLGYASAGPVPWMAVDRYCERHEITGEQCEDMHYFVAKMDEAYLKWQRAKSPKTTTTGQNNG